MYVVKQLTTVKVNSCKISAYCLGLFIRLWISTSHVSLLMCLVYTELNAFFLLIELYHSKVYIVFPLWKVILTVWKAIRISNNLDPDQTWQNVGPDLEQNCFSKVINRQHKQVKSPTETTKWYVHPWFNHHSWWGSRAVRYLGFFNE